MTKAKETKRRGPAKQYDSKVLLPISETLLKRAEAVTVNGESRLDVIRMGAEKEVKRRERTAAKPKP